MKYIILVLSLLIVGGLSAQSNKINFKGKVKFVSEAPLEIIKAESKNLAGIIDKSSYGFAFSVQLKSFEGFNSTLQKEHFHENYLESDKFPSITYVGKILDKIDWAIDGVYEVRTKGDFIVHGITKEKIFKNKIQIKNGITTITAKFIIALADFDITIPRIVNKKIAEEIDISLEIVQLPQ